MKKETKTSEVINIYEAISEKILSGEYPAGYRLVESKLASTFGVSRTPVRCAIERLISEGLVKHVVNRGAVVRHMTIEEIRDLFKAREVNEALIARLASQRVREGDSEILYGVLNEMREALEVDDFRKYYNLSHKIHLHIMDMAQNEFLKDFVIKIYRITYRYHIGIMLLPGRAAQSYEEHRKIIEAVLSKDSELAEKTMLNHVRRIIDFYNDEQNRVFYKFFSNPYKVD